MNGDHDSEQARLAALVEEARAHGLDGVAEWLEGVKLLLDVMPESRDYLRILAHKLMQEHQARDARIRRLSGYVP